MAKYFTIQELCASTKANALKIDNTPNAEIKDNLTKLIDKILDPLREAYGKPIIVSSGYRCTALNKAVGGSTTSQHRFGQAADIKCKSDTSTGNKEIFDLILKLGLPYDQLINEYNYDWVHVSYSPRNRRQVFAAVKVNGHTIYKKQK